MKKFLAFLFLSVLTLSVHAQKDETIFGRSGVRLTGIWGGSTSYINGFQEDYDVYGGGFFTFELNKSVLLGWSNHDMRSTLNAGGTVNLNTNDFLIGFSPSSSRSFHPYFYTAIGSGKASLSTEGTDRIIAIQPSASLELNILRWLRLSLDGGYRFVSGSDFESVSDTMLSSPFVGLRLKFGWSWGR